MKHKFLLLVLLFFIVKVQAQSITISGAKNGLDYNNAYFDFNGQYEFYGYITTNQYGMPTPYNGIVGSAVYRRNNPNSSPGAYYGSAYYELIYKRFDGKWVIGWYVSNGSTEIEFRTLHAFESLSNTLPCQAVWNDYNGSQYGHAYPPVSNSTITVTSGSCDMAYPPSSATEVEPAFVRLPNLPSAAAPASPKNGTMYYDLSTHTVKVYSNGQWKSLAWQ